MIRSRSTPPSTDSKAWTKPSHRSSRTTRQGSRSLGGARALLADVGVPLLGQGLLPLRELLLQEGDQAVHPVGLGPRHDRPDVGEGHQREQGVVAGVDAVEVHVLGRAQPRDPAGEHPQAVAAPGA